MHFNCDSHRFPQLIRKQKEVLFLLLLLYLLTWLRRESDLERDKA